MGGFFFDYILLQAFSHLLIGGLLKLTPLIMKMAIFAFATTPRKKASVWSADPPEFGLWYANALIVATVALVFSIISPIISLVALAYFCIARLVFSYEWVTSFTEWAKSDSGGVCWMSAFDMMKWSLLLFQVSTAGVLLLKQSGGFMFLWLVLPCCVFTWWFWLHTIRDYQQMMDTVASSAEDPPNPPTLLNVEMEGKHNPQPMSLVKGVLDVELMDYQHPALIGTLPWLWVEDEAEEQQ